MAIPTKSHVALVPSPGLGHLIPIMELAKRLVTHYNLTATVIAAVTEAVPAEAALLRAAASSNLIDVVVLPHVDISDQVQPDDDILVKLVAMMRGAIPFVRSTITAMRPRPLAVIIDLFGTELIKVAEECDMLKYVYIASNAWLLAYAAYFPYLDKRLERSDLFVIPGCDHIPGDDLFKLTFYPEGRAYREYRRMGLEITTADGVLVNTWHDLEPKTMAAFSDEKFMKPVIRAPVYPVGPLVRRGEPVAGSRSKLFEWLDMQPNESVVYVSFGSGGTLSAQQTTELAWGLELSQQRFVWVVRPPTQNDVAASLFGSLDNTNKISEFLPDGFLDRTREIGRAVPMWAPQEEILAHPSVGGFISHCGWNSTLESITNEVPIISWPLYAEQDMNCTMLTQTLGVAIRPRVKPSEGVIKREEIEEMVKKIMVENEGSVLRTRVKALTESAEKALREGGSSYTALSHVAKECEMGLTS